MNASRLVSDSFRVPLQTLQRTVQASLYRGEAFHCSVCEHDFGKFKSAGHPRRPNAECPRCGARERHRLMMYFLDNFTNLGRTDDPVRLLHLAPERMLARRMSSYPNVDYLSGDINPTRAQAVVDVTRMQFDDDSFDAIICSHVLEHVADDKAAMREMCRVLRPDGWAIINAPVRNDLEDTFEDWSVTAPKARAQMFGQWDHVRCYGRNYPELLGSAGFQVAIDPFPIPADVKRRFALQHAGRIFYCTKRG